jgi:hypothetical protein
MGLNPLLEMNVRATPMRSGTGIEQLSMIGTATPALSVSNDAIPNMLQMVETSQPFLTAKEG